MLNLKLVKDVRKRFISRSVLSEFCGSEVDFWFIILFKAFTVFPCSQLLTYSSIAKIFEAK